MSRWGKTRGPRVLSGRGRGIAALTLCLVAYPPILSASFAEGPVGSRVLAMLDGRSPGERSGALTAKGKAMRAVRGPTIDADVPPRFEMGVPPSAEAPPGEMITAGGEDVSIVLPTFTTGAPSVTGGTVVGGPAPSGPGGPGGGGGFVAPPVGGGSGGGGVLIPPSPPFEMESPTPMPTETPPLEMENPTPFPTPTPPFEMEPPTPMPGVPEPATWAMLIMGFGIIGTAMRRRNNHAIA